MDRNDFQKLAQMRLEEAKFLRDGGKYDGAYYLAGYAVECALKACIAKLMRAEEFPPSPDIVKKLYSHSLDQLLNQAQLRACESFQNGGLRTLSVVVCVGA